MKTAKYLLIFTIFPLNVLRHTMFPQCGLHHVTTRTKSTNSLQSLSFSDFIILWTSATKSLWKYKFEKLDGMDIHLVHSLTSFFFHHFAWSSCIKRCNEGPWTLIFCTEFWLSPKVKFFDEFLSQSVWAFLKAF